MSARPPLVLLTGFLGAGKTTVLNRVLGASLRRRVAVIVNELGRIDVDGKLLKARSGDVLELAGGCVCHEVRTQDELWDGIREIRKRSSVDVIVLETTGIALPGPILEGLARFPDDERPAEAAGVVTVVDAEAGAGQLERFSEARAQVEAADRLLLSKLDRAVPGEVEALHARLAALNPFAERAHFPPGNEGTHALVGWLLDHPRRDAPDDDEDHDHDHSHGAQLVAASHVDDVPLLAAPLLRVIDELGDSILRIKGWVDIAGEPRRGFLERAGRHTELRFLDPWPPGPRRTELVLIGEALDPAAIRRRLWAARGRDA